MASDGLCWMPASEMAAAIRRKKVSPVEVMKEVLARIDRLNPTLNAFVTLTAEQAMRDARAAERALGKKGTKLAWVHHGLAHEEYHRGQLAVYERLMGIEPALTRMIRGG